MKMKLAKAAFALAVAAVYWAFGMALLYFWRTLPPWQFWLGLFCYLPPATFLFFLAGMVYERGKKDDAPPQHKIPELADWIVTLLKPMAAAHNAANNLYPMTVLFLDLPWNPELKFRLELATTMRMNRYEAGPAGRRRDGALFVQTQLLHWADPDGRHR